MSDHDDLDVDRTRVELDDDDDDGNQSMSQQQITDPSKSEPQQAVARLVEVLKEKHVCPFCGAVRDAADGACARCSMEDTPATRQATKARIGPWYVLQSRNPAAPGMRWSTLVSLVRKGQITPKTIVRGPTSHQLWKFAYTIKGLSREFGLCYACAGEIERTANLCPHCQRLQEPPMNPDVLLEGKPASSSSSSSSSSRSSAERSAPAAAMSSEISVPARPDRPAPPREPNAGFLSAKDLAAAFQLQVPAGAQATAVGAGEGATATLSPPPKRSSSKGFKVVLSILFLAAVATSVALGLKPEWREQVVMTAKQTLAQAQEKLKPVGDSIERTPPPPAPEPRIPPANVNHDDLATAAEVPPARSSPLDPLAATTPQTPQEPANGVPAPAAVVPTPTPVAKADEPKAAAPALPEPTEPAKPVESAQAPDPAPKAPAAEPAKPEAKIEVAAPTPPPAAPKPAASAKTPAAATADGGGNKPAAATVVVSEAGPEALEKAREKARIFWRAAIDAESRQDYAEAVAIYEEIKKLPREVWQSNLELNLNWAKKQLEGKK